MSEEFTDEDLIRLRRAGGEAACKDARVVALLRKVVDDCLDRKIHWLLADGREEILAGWLERRLLTGRLAAMIDTAASVRALSATASKDLHQYAIDVHRGDLSYRLFERLERLLPEKPERYQVMMAARRPGSTFWTISTRPASTIFSEREQELRAHVWALDLKPLAEDPEAKKQTQFLTAPELDRYAFGMLDRTARGLSLDQLVLALVQCYGLKPSFHELPDENALKDSPFAGERQGIETADPPEPPGDDCTSAARALIDTLTARQLELFKALYAQRGTQAEAATELGCSQATISNEKTAIRAALENCAKPEEQVEVISTTIKLLDGTPQ